MSANKLLLRRRAEELYKLNFQGSQLFYFADEAALRAPTTEFSTVMNLDIISGLTIFAKESGTGWISYRIQRIDASLITLYFDRQASNAWVQYSIPCTAGMKKVVIRWKHTGTAANDCQAWVGGVSVSVSVSTQNNYSLLSNGIGYGNLPLCFGSRQQTAVQTGTYKAFDIALYSRQLNTTEIDDFNSLGTIPANPMIYLPPTKRTDTIVPSGGTAANGTLVGVSDYDLFYENR